MCPTSIVAEEIHKKAVEISSRYRKAEAELIEVLQQVDVQRIFLNHGHPSLFQYVVRELGLSESVAYNLIAVSRKALEIPELKTELQKGTITLTNAKRIIPVLNRENQSEWLQKASQLSQRELEKEIVRIRPEEATPERATYVTPTRLQLSLGISEKNMIRLRRAQDILSQSRKRAVTLEEVVEQLAEDYLKRHDPLERAKRQHGKRTATTPQTKSPTKTIKTQVARPVRDSIPADLLYRVTLRDQSQCTFVNLRGERCSQTRWLEIHHRIPLSQGGKNTLQNLVTLCSSHHRWLHGLAEGDGFCAGVGKFEGTVEGDGAILGAVVGTADGAAVGATAGVEPLMTDSIVFSSTSDP